MEGERMIVPKVIVCDRLVQGCEYEVKFTIGITNENCPETVRETRFPGYYMGFIIGKDGARCTCCHRLISDGTHGFLNPFNGHTYHVCPKCLSSAVSCIRMDYHCNEIMTEYWKYETDVEKKNFLKEYAGAFIDILHWMEIEPELADEIKKKILDAPDRDIPPEEKQ